MLQKDKLIKGLREGLEPMFKNSLKTAFKATNPYESDAMDDAAEIFGESFSKTFVPVFSEFLGTVIDAYIKSANIYGNVVTTGSSTMQRAKISSTSPITNGSIPNTFGIK